MIYTTTDGHTVHSLNEYIVDEFLHIHHIPHQVDGYIDSTKSKLRFDFKIKDYFVEIWGYEKRSNSKRCETYAKRRKYKEDFYSKNHLKLISLESNIFKWKVAKIETYLYELFNDIGFNLSKNHETIKPFCGVPLPGLWNKEAIIKELSIIYTNLGHFPLRTELRKMKRCDLAKAIDRNGGMIVFRKHFDLKPATRPKKEVTKDIIADKVKLGDLSQLDAELANKLSLNQRNNKTRKNNYWSEEIIINELKKVIDVYGHFPVYNELKMLKRHDLIRVINRTGGYVKYQKLLGFRPTKKPVGFWTDEKIIEEIKNIGDKIGKIPSYSEIKQINKTLISAIDRTKKGYNHFLELIKQP